MAQGSDAWLALRLGCAATCSRYGDAVGVGYTSPRRYMQEKLGLKPAPELNWMMRRGNEMEPTLCERYWMIMRGVLGKRVKLFVDNFGVDPSDVRLGGSVDRLVQDEETGERWVLECKTAYNHNVRDHVPPTHSLQMLGLCHLYGLRKAHYICWTENVGIYVAEVTWKRGFWETVVYPRLRQFAYMWENKIVPPRQAAGSREDMLEEIEENTEVRSLW